jgi:hypothetical protein
MSANDWRFWEAELARLVGKAVPQLETQRLDSKTTVQSLATLHPTELYLSMSCDRNEK